MTQPRSLYSVANRTPGYSAPAPTPAPRRSQCQQQEQFEVVPPSNPEATVCDMIKGALWLAGL